MDNDNSSGSSSYGSVLIAEGVNCRLISIRSGHGFTYDLTEVVKNCNRTKPGDYNWFGSNNVRPLRSIVSNAETENRSVLEML